MSKKPKLSLTQIFIIIITLIFGGVFYTILQGGNDTPQFAKRDIPVFSMPALSDDSASFLTSEDLKKHAPLLVNIWASWCAPCRAEHSVLEKLSTVHNIKIIGINYKDTKENAQGFINKFGNPFFKIGLDINGLYSLDWGIRGVPETFVINKAGKVVYKHQGELTLEKMNDFLNILQANDFIIKRD